MRIAYLCADLGIPLFGSKGASVHVRELVRAFSSFGHEVRVLTPRAGGEPAREFPADVVEIRPDRRDEGVCELLRSDPGAGPVAARDVRALLYSTTFGRRALELLDDFRPELVYERYSLFGTAGREVASACGAPLVVEVNAPLVDEQAEHRGLVLERTARAMERDVLLAADRIVTVSTALRDWLVELGVDTGRIEVLANGVDVERFEAAGAERARMRARLGGDRELFVGFVGSLKPWHDVALLVEAVARLRRQGRRARLVVIGEGPQLEALEHAAREARVAATFTGAVPHERVPACLAALDVAVAPYAPTGRFYFSPLKLVEYMAAGLPTVAADVGDLGRCIQPGETGWLYRPGDVGELTRTIARIAEDGASAARVAAAGREHVRAEHTWRGNAERIVHLVAAVGSAAR